MNRPQSKLWSALLFCNLPDGYSQEIDGFCSQVASHRRGILTAETQGLICFRRSTHNCAAHNYVLTMKTNITLKLDSDALREARILAAQEGVSISGLLSRTLEEIVRQRKGYDRSRRRALARLRKGFDLGWTPPSSRDEFHER